MKNILILFTILVSGISCLAAEPQPPLATATATPACSVYVSNNNIVICNNGSTPAEVTMFGKFGAPIVKSSIADKQMVPVKDLPEGKYIIKVKTQNGEQNIKLSIL